MWFLYFIAMFASAGVDAPVRPHTPALRKNPPKSKTQLDQTLPECSARDNKDDCLVPGCVWYDEPAECKGSVNPELFDSWRNVDPSGHKIQLDNAKFWNDESVWEVKRTKDGGFYVDNLDTQGASKPSGSAHLDAVMGLLMTIGVTLF